MYDRLYAVYDEEYGLGNIIVALSLDVKEVIFFYRDISLNKSLRGLKKIFDKQSKVLRAIYVDNNEIFNSLLKDDHYILDISSSKRISLKLFEYSLNNNSMIVYYDKLENRIKDYKSYKALDVELYKMNIEEILLTKGAILKSSMHKSPKLNDQDYIDKLMIIMQRGLQNYKKFTNFILKVNNLFNEDKVERNIINSAYYKLFNELDILSIQNNKLVLKDRRYRELFSIVGTWLEEYIYIILSKSGLFDEVIMSAVIDFDERIERYPITCEVDGVVLKDNHLVLISCKSNSLNKDAINEIALHNFVFGNNMSHSLLTVSNNINVVSPALYLKAKELKVAVLDLPNILDPQKIVKLVNDIINGTYEYEEVRR